MPFTIHSDGTLKPGDIAGFRDVFANVRFVQREEVKAWANRRLGGQGFERSRTFLDGHFFGCRLLGVHMSEQARTVLMMDTDILFFDRPDEVFDIVNEPDGRLTSFGDDFDWVSVVAPSTQLEHRCGRVEPRFNCGFLVMPRFGDEQFRFVERVLRACEPAWREHYFADQAVLALAAGHYGWNELPPLCYRIGDGSDAAGATAIHDVSNKAVRAKFYTDGLVRLIRDVQVEKRVGPGLRRGSQASPHWR